MGPSLGSTRTFFSRTRKDLSTALFSDSSRGYELQGFHNVGDFASGQLLLFYLLFAIFHVTVRQNKHRSPSVHMNGTHEGKLELREALQRRKQSMNMIITNGIFNVSCGDRGILPGIHKDMEKPHHPVSLLQMRNIITV